MTTGRRVLVTGGNAGIGYAAAEQLAEAGWEVLLGCRDAARGASAAAAIVRAVPGASVSVLALDMASQASIRAAAAQVDRLDALVHNAAYFDIRTKARTETAEGVETTWATNHLGPALLTELLLPNLRASADARVVAVTSKGLMMFPGLAVDLDDPEFARRRFTVARAYYHSKLAHLAWMLTQAERFRDGGPRFHGVRVTNVKIDLARYPGLAWPFRAMYAVKSAFSISPAEMARAYTWAVTDAAAGAETGGYWDAPARPAAVSRWARDASNRAALDALTRRQLGLP